jgi:mannose PTS system EIID component
LARISWHFSKHSVIITLLRSLFLQSSWNLERMQNLGFLYAILPSLRRIYHVKADQKSAALRHLEFFNSQPYMACLIMGAVIRMEQECEEKQIKEEDISQFKAYTMTAFAAIGDSFFWNSLKPFCLTLALMFAYRGLFWSCLIFLIPYNMVHLFLRSLGFWKGLEEGVGLIDRIIGWNIPSCTGWVKKVLPVLLGVLLSQSTIFVSGRILSFYPLIALFVTLISYMLIKRNISPIAIIMFIFVVTSVTIYAGGGAGG